MSDDLGRDLPPGAHHYRAFVGRPDAYDLLAAHQFNLLTRLGLRKHHSLLDIGCGSLRAGRLPYLLPGNYYGIEPEQWLVKEGIAKELGEDALAIKKPTFIYESNFDLKAFGKTFDYILAQSIFTHASISRIEQCTKAARAAMNENSIFVANFLEGEIDDNRAEWAYPHCVTHTMNALDACARASLLSLASLAQTHPTGASWILLKPA
jgi:hypothetical protein